MSEPTVADPMIEVSGVCKAFGETRALDGVDLQVPTATVLGLLGPNGAGKTTLVKVLATLLRPDAGWAKVDGLDVVRQPVAVRSRDRPGRAVRRGRRGADRPGEPGDGRTAVPPEPQRGEGAGRGGAGAPEPGRCRRPLRPDVLRRDAAAARPGGEPRGPAPRADPRRADDRARPAHADGALGLHPAARARRHDRAPDDAVPGGGRRARAVHRRHRPRHGHRPGHLR